jgi:hypothetical protein
VSCSHFQHLMKGNVHPVRGVANVVGARVLGIGETTPILRRFVVDIVQGLAYVKDARESGLIFKVHATTSLMIN